MIHKLFRDPKYALDSELIEGETAETQCFLPVQIFDSTPAKETAPTIDAKSAQSAIEIDIASGHPLRIVGSYDPEALVRLIRGLSA